MQWGKVKNILIVILAAINVFLLGNLCMKQWQAWQRESELRAHLSTLLEGYGLALDPRFKLPGDAALPQLSLDRSRASEETVSAALLGDELNRTEQEDGAVRLENDAGWLEWRADGSVSGEFETENASQAEKEAEKQARRLLEKWGVRREDTTLTSEGLAVTASGRAAGMPVFNRALTFTFDGEGGVTLSGLWFFGTPYTTARENSVVCVPSDALLEFAAAQEGCTSVRSMEAGYRLQSDSSRRLQLVPTWRIVTDGGEYLIDGAKKSIVTPQNAG